MEQAGRSILCNRMNTRAGNDEREQTVTLNGYAELIAQSSRALSILLEMDKEKPEGETHRASSYR